jgi:hypothetical protein
MVSELWETVGMAKEPILTFILSKPDRFHCSFCGHKSRTCSALVYTRLRTMPK